MSNWTEALNPGDIVAVPERYSSRHSLQRVDRITATQIVLKDGTKHRRSDGKSVGLDSWNSYFLRQATPDIINDCQDRADRETLRSIANGAFKVSRETLRAMVALAYASKPQ